MTDVKAVTSPTISLAEAAKKSASAKGESAIDADAFMMLLLTQLKNQNPLEPMKENEMMVQMAQLNSVEELRKMGSSMKDMEKSNQILSASNLIGKMISYLGTDGTSLSALAKSVSITSDEVMINTDTFSLPLSKITGIEEAALDG
jgi:flagellar basal-body rod modification protein FlgD